MATQASTPARRVLSDLNVNSNVARQTPATQKLIRPTGLENPSHQDYKPHNILYKTIETGITEVVQMGDRKRLRVGEPEELPIKRRSAGIAYGGLGTGASSLPQQTLEPISPSDTSMEGFNSIPSSQETIKTVEDEPSNPVPTRSSSLSAIPPAELRKRAQSMALRLRLANYKVETNQIDIPISKLEVISSPRLPALPQYSGSFTCPKPRTRTPLPTTVPDIQVRRPSSEPNPRIPSSPPSQVEEHNEESMSPTKPFVTPLLPRRRDGLSNMPGNASPTRKDPSGRDLTSSVVKKTAADSLLDLMRQNEYSRSF